MAAPKAADKQQLGFVDLYGISTVQHSTPSFHRHWNPLGHVTEIYFVRLRFHLSALTSWHFTWAEAVEVVVSSVRQVPGEGVGVNFGWGGGIRAQRKPPMEQILLLHPDNLLVLWGEGRKDLEMEGETEE